MKRSVSGVIILVNVCLLITAACLVNTREYCSLSVKIREEETEGGQRESGSGAVKSGESRTVVPDTPIALSRVQISGTGPRGETFSCSSSEEAVSVSHLLPGMWQVNVEGYNSGDLLVAQGSASMELLPYRENSCEIVIRPVSGTGSLKVSIQWAETAVYDPRVTGTISGNGMESGTIPFIVEGPGAGADFNGLNCGYYIVSALVHDGDVHVGGFTEAVRIVSGLTTNVLYTVDADSSELSWTIGLRFEMNNPVTLGLEHPAYSVVQGDRVDWKCILPQDLQSASVSWYLNGRLLESNGETITLDTTGLLRNNRVDAVVLSPDGSRGGSMTGGLPVEPFTGLGDLFFRASFVDSPPGIDGLTEARDVVATPDGSRIFVAGFGDDSIAEFHAAPGSPSVRYSGRVRKSASAPLGGVSSLALSPDGVFLFAASATDGSVTVLAGDQAGGLYTPIASLPASVLPMPVLEGVSGIAVSPDGKSVYTASSVTGRVGVFSFDPGSKTLTLQQTVSSSDVSSGQFFTPKSIEVSPDGTRVAVGCYNGDSVFILTRHPETGLVQPQQVFSDGIAGVEGLNGIEGLKFSADGRTLYCCSYYDSALSVFVLDEAQGEFLLLEEHRNLEGAVTGLKYAKEVAVSADGGEVYVSGSSDDSLAVFTRNLAGSRHAFLGSFVNGSGRVKDMDGPRGVAVTAAGRVLVCAGGSNSLCMFDRR